MAEIPSRRRHKLAVIDSIAADIARAWDGRNALRVAAQFGLPPRCVYTAILMLNAELTWLLSLQQACVELSPTQSARLSALLELFPGERLPHQDRAFAQLCEHQLLARFCNAFVALSLAALRNPTSQGPQQ